MNICLSVTLCSTQNILAASNIGRHSDLSRPPRGVITPSVFMRHPPNHLKFKGGYQGGVYGGGDCVIVMEGVINNNKMLMYKIWSFYSQEYC